VTLIRYTVGTVKNCESGGAPAERPPFLLGWLRKSRRERLGSRFRGN